MRVLLCLLTAALCSAQGVLIDQIAVIVDKSIIKDSDIERDIRVTQFLNNQPLQINAAVRKQAASKLIEQVFLRDEIRTGAYLRATQEQSNKQLEALIAQRFRTQEAFHSALTRYGIDEATLRDQFRWQLTVLSFIDARFKPAVLITDPALDKYYQAHAAALRKESPTGSADDLRLKARDILTEEEVNRLFFAWLDERRKAAKISFHEEGLT